MLAGIVERLLRFGGFVPSPPPVQPRRKPLAPTRIPKAAASPAQVTPQARPRIVQESRFGLHTACIRYSRAIDSGSWDVMRQADREQIHHVMGKDLAAWQRVLRLTNGTPWRAAESLTETTARSLVRRQWMAELDRWEAALRNLDRRTALAIVLGRQLEEPLHLPDDVVAALEARRAAALARAQQRARRGVADGGAVPANIPGEPPEPPPPEPPR